MSTDSALKLGERLKFARESLGFTQQKMAEKVGCSKSAWVEYEYDLKIPGSKVLAGLAKLDFNTNWILLGQGLPREICLEEKLQVLAEVISAVESFLKQAKKHNLLLLEPDKKNKWIVALYEDFLKKEGGGLSRGNVEEEVHHKMGRVLI